MLDLRQLQQNKDNANDDLLNEVKDLRRRFDEYEANSEIKLDLPVEQQDSIRNIVKDKLMELVWNDFFYTSGFTPFTLTTTGAAWADVTAYAVGDYVYYGGDDYICKVAHTSATANDRPSTGTNWTTYWNLTEYFERLRDTTGGEFLVPSRPCKLRVGFYFGGAGLGDNATTYITTAHVRTDVDSLLAIDANGSEYVGIKIVDNAISLIAHNELLEKTRTKTIKETITSDETNILEIQFFPKERVDFYLNNNYVGTITDALPSSTPMVFYPLFCSMTRTDTTQHKLNIDFYEFIQTRK